MADFNLGRSANLINVVLYLRRLFSSDRAVFSVATEATLHKASIVWNFSSSGIFDNTDQLSYCGTRNAFTLLAMVWQEFLTDQLQNLRSDYQSSLLCYKHMAVATIHNYIFFTDVLQGSCPFLDLCGRWRLFPFRMLKKKSSLSDPWRWHKLISVQGLMFCDSRFMYLPSRAPLSPWLWTAVRAVLPKSIWNQSYELFSPHPYYSIHSTSFYQIFWMKLGSSPASLTLPTRGS